MDRIAVTGGNGKIGRAILEEAGDRGYRAINVARGKQREEVSDEYYTTDLLTAGEVYGSIARADPDAVIHMGTIPSPTSHPGYVTFLSNAQSSYHVLEAARSLGIDRVCLASSINAIGYDFQDEKTVVDYLPVDEDHRRTPRDPYAIGKHALEVTADGFGRMDGAPRTIGSLRYPAVLSEEQLRSRFSDESDSFEEVKESWEDSGNDLFTYIGLEDAANIAVDVVEADYDGHELFWAVASDTVTEVPTPKLVEEFYSHAEVHKEFDDHESLISIEKARDLLGWTPEQSWRDL